MEAQLREILLADPSVAALIGVRLFPVMASEQPSDASGNPLAYATYMIASSKDDPTLDAAGHVTTTQRVQYDLWASTYATCDCMRKAFDAVLRGFVGPLSDGCRILSLQRENIITSFSPVNRLFHTTVEYTVIFSEV